MMIKQFKLWEKDILACAVGTDCPNRVTAYIREKGIRPLSWCLRVVAIRFVCHTRVAHVAEYYYNNGYNAFVVDYRVAPNRHPAPLMDAQRAVKLVRLHAEEWRVDPDKVFIIGFSAGGHLAGCGDDGGCLPCRG